MTTAKQASNRTVHYYDTRQHRVACGAAMADEHSTKHVRSVTCEVCLGVLREAAVEEGEETRRGGEATEATAAL
jgi:hypothetical protein